MEWVSVEDRLPEDKILIMVYSIALDDEEDGDYDIAVLDNGGFYYFGWGGHGCGDEWNKFLRKVTHWMSLPQPPKDI